MSQVNVINVIAHNAKAPFLTPLSFEIFFEALQPLRHSKCLPPYQTLRRHYPDTDNILQL